MSRILRGLSSRRLSCGCLLGVYETYDGKVVDIIDARGAACPLTAHAPGRATGDRDPRQSADDDR